MDVSSTSTVKSHIRPTNDLVIQVKKFDNREDHACICLDGNYNLYMAPKIKTRTQKKDAAKRIGGAGVYFSCSMESYGTCLVDKNTQLPHAKEREHNVTQP